MMLPLNQLHIMRIMLPGVFLLIQLLQFTPCTAKPLPVAAASIIANSYAGNISIHQLTDQTTTTTTTHNHISQQYLLRLKQSQQQPLATDLLIQLQTLIKQQTGLSIDITAINQITNAFQGLIVKTDIPLPVEWIQQQVPFIDMVEQDHPWTSQQVQSQLGDRGWGLDRLDSTISNRPLDSSYTFDSTGKNVNVYVVDSGIDAGHGEFGGRAETVYHSPRFTDSVDCQGHGTHVAGIVAGTNVGVAKQANLKIVRVVDCKGASSTMEIVAALDWILANHQKPAVVTMSLGPDLNSNGKYPASVALDEAVRAIVNAGIPMVVAAGNDDTVPCYAAPAGSDGIIAVAATDSSDRRASFSNHGECISLFAPGVEIFSSVPRTSSSSVPLINTGDPYVLKSGTSQAAPYVAGVIALYLEKNPQASPWQVRDALRAAASKSTVKDGRMAEALLLQSISIPEPNSPEALGQLVNLVSLYSLGGFEWTPIKIAVFAMVAAISVLILIFASWLCHRRRNLKN